MDTKFATLELPSNKKLWNSWLIDRHLKLTIYKMKTNMAFIIESGQLYSIVVCET